MNKENLLRAADYIETIPDCQFSMSCWWRGSYDECGSIGCIVGHCYNHFGPGDQPDFEANYWLFCEDFFGIEYESTIGKYLFSYTWEEIDNTPIGAAMRIRHVVENGLPENWDDQMFGDAQLSYL